MISNLRTTFIYVGIFVRNKYVPQFEHVSPINRPMHALEVNIPFHGAFDSPALWASAMSLVSSITYSLSFLLMHLWLSGESVAKKNQIIDQRIPIAPKQKTAT